MCVCAVGLATGGVYLGSDRAPAQVAQATTPDPVNPVAAITPRLAQPAQATPTAQAAGLRLATDTTSARPFRLPGAIEKSSRDVDCLTAAVYYEARGETTAGQAAVAQVVLNRVRHPAFPKTVCGVVYQGVHTSSGCQFSFACNGASDRPRELGAWRRAQGVAMHALAGGVMTAVGDATNFHAARAGASFGRGMTRVAQVGLQVFYKFSGYEGAPARFAAEARRSTDDDAQPAQTEGRPSGEYILASAPAPDVSQPVAATAAKTAATAKAAGKDAPPARSTAAAGA